MSEQQRDAFRGAFKRAKDSWAAQAFIEIQDEKVICLTVNGERNACYAFVKGLRDPKGVTSVTGVI